MINVIVVDDHPLFRQGIKFTFNNMDSGIIVIGEAECGEELFKLLVSSVPDLVLLDINLPDISGVEIARRLRKDYPEIKILAISAENTAETIKAMLDVGINGFISKRKSGTEELAEAIHSVMNGLEYFGRDISAIIFDIFVAKKKTTIATNEFTDREKEIIIACKEGLLCKEIASRLGISINTVNTHKKNIFQKLGINNTMEMVQYALKNGIIRMSEL
ncbi:MAG: response regulator transcription factor [Firmicutes bacterium]|nr:response regulator transcription factor [Bacillota bacterium]